MTFGGSKLGAKVNKKSIENELNMGRYLGIDFLWILVDFWVPSWEGKWSQDQSNKASKNDEKKKGAKMAKKSQ